MPKEIVEFISQSKIQQDAIMQMVTTLSARNEPTTCPDYLKEIDQLFPITSMEVFDNLNRQLERADCRNYMVILLNLKNICKNNFCYVLDKLFVIAG